MISKLSFSLYLKIHASFTDNSKRVRKPQENHILLDYIKEIFLKSRCYTLIFFTQNFL